MGNGIQMVKRKIEKQPAIPTNLIPEIISELFPTHAVVESVANNVTTPVPPITLQELEIASRRLYPGKAPGSDGRLEQRSADGRGEDASSNVPGGI